MSEERRRVCIAADFDTSGRAGRGLVRNVSLGGLFVGTTSPPEPGRSVRLRFRMPDGEAVSLTGRVCWTTSCAGATNFQRPHGFGVELLRVQPRLRRLLGGR